MTSIRGAITVAEDTRESILEAAREILLQIIKKNNVDLSQIVDVFFTTTKDLSAVYPAVAAREIGIVQAGLVCVTEMDVKGSLPMCLRVLLHVELPGKKQADMEHIYLRGAEVLRPDLALKKKDKPIAVAIDGPLGSGKSTVAREVAKAAGIVYIDTGAMYRAVAFYNIQRSNDLKDEAIIENSLLDITISIRHDLDKQQRLVLNDEDVTEQLRTQKVAEGSSVVASYPAVRKKLVALQQSMARSSSVVMDGRDIASHVLPDAQVKVYLDASLEERVQRRIGELKEKGQSAVYEEILKETEIRDHRDMNRTFAPLKRAEDAIYIQSDGLTVDDIVGMILYEMEKVR